MMKKIALVFGTRPEIVKLSPIIRLLQKKEQPFVLIHSGQHYSFNMDQQFFNDLKLPEPGYKFTRPSKFGANMHEEILVWIEDSVRRVLETEKPHAVLVQGDTNTVLAGARAASRFKEIVIGHVEAGLRSYDNNMPEERNRIATDKLSHILFAPTESAKKNLIMEKFDEKKIDVTGNTIVDAVLENLKIAEKMPDRDKFKKGYALVTLHRPETVDNKDRLVSVMHALEGIAREKGIRIIFPVHPRTKQRLEECGMKLIDLNKRNISTPEPMGFLDFIWYEKNADIILTDSGGVQEEACILKVPCVTIRTTTERPETVEVGANIVAGYGPNEIRASAETMIASSRNWKNPFGDGHASERILATIDKATP